MRFIGWLGFVFVLITVGWPVTILALLVGLWAWRIWGRSSIG